MRLLILTKYTRLGASSRLRTFQYLSYLEQSGFDVTVQSLFDDAYLTQLYEKGRRSLRSVFFQYLKRLAAVLKIWRYDVVWVEKELFPYFPAIAERLMGAVGIRYIVDYDDAIFHNYDRSSNPLFRYFLGRKIDVVMRNAWAVSAGNDYLADRARRAGARRVERLPTVIDLKRYDVGNKTTQSGCTIGWIGSPSTQKYLIMVREALARLCAESGARVLIVGAAPVFVEREFADMDVEVAAWSEEGEVAQIQRMDVGIMPLPDTPWERGKCGYKLIQYMACGLPVVASPVGVNADIVEANVNGYLARDCAEWRSSLDRLATEPSTRRRMGAAARRIVEQRFSTDVVGPELQRLLTAAAGESAKTR